MRLGFSGNTKFSPRRFMRKGTEQSLLALLSFFLLFGYFRKSFANCQNGNHRVCACLCVSLCFFSRDHCLATETSAAINTQHLLCLNVTEQKTHLKHFIYLIKYNVKQYCTAVVVDLGFCSTSTHVPTHTVTKLIYMTALREHSTVLVELLLQVYCFNYLKFSELL